MRRKPIVGEALFLKQLNKGRDAGLLRPVKVTKVGRKYFKCKVQDWHEQQFEIESWDQVSEYSADYVLYETEAEYNDTVERKRIIDILRDEFGGWIDSKLHLETLRQIRDLVAQAKKHNT
jgi:hypothetical protein